MAQRLPNDLESSTGEAHPFGVTANKELKATNKCTSTSTATGLRHRSIVTNSFSDCKTHFWNSYGRDVSIAVLFVISLTALSVVMWHTVQTASTLAKLSAKDTELQITDDALLNDVNKITQNLAYVTETLTVLSKNITELEASSEVVQNLTRKVQGADPRETSTGPIVLAAHDDRILLQVPCTGTYFFHIVIIFQPSIDSQLDFRLYIGSTYKTAVNVTYPGETFVRAYTKPLVANDYVRILNVGDEDLHIAEFIINSHLIGI